MSILGIHHSSVIVKNTTRSVKFYSQILGLEVDHSRPDIGYPGAWLTVGQQQIHLLELDNPDPVDNRPAHGGRDRHVALVSDDLNELIIRLEQNSITFTLSKSGRNALFFRDPDGNAVEVIEQA